MSTRQPLQTPLKDTGDTAPLTLLQYFSKVLVVAGAVPPAVPELVLALPDAQSGPFGHFADDLRLVLAQLGLLPGQPPRLPADAVRVHDQRTAHSPARASQHSQHRHTRWGEGGKVKLAKGPVIATI